MAAATSAACYNVDMPDTQPIELLLALHFLRDVDEEDLLTLAATLTLEEYTAGDVVYHQGSRANSMYFIAQGLVEIIQKDNRGQEHSLGKLDVSDTFGETEMIFREPRIVTIRAVEPTRVYRWDRKAMSAFMETHPEALAALKFAAQSRRMACGLRFDWLNEGEVVHGLARKHSILLIRALIVPLILLSIAIVSAVWGLTRDNLLVSIMGIGIAIVAMALGLWNGLDWSNDFYIITNQRAVWLEKIIAFYDSRREAPLHMILSVSISTEVLGRMLGYGDVIIRTFTGRLVFRNTDHPYAMAAMIEKLQKRIRTKDEDADRDSLRELIHQRLVPETASKEPIEPTSVDKETAPVNQASRETSSSHLSPKMRFEDKNKKLITYHKHWAVLLNEISAPSVLFLFLVGLIGARIAGLLQILTLSTFLLYTLLALIPTTLWWLYRYVDWANDIYQITEEQIVDIYKKPLSRELRKVAPLENILSTEVDRKGLVGIMLNYGTVIANVGTEEFDFLDVFDPIGVQQDIVHAQEALLQRKKEKDRHQRQGEMVELIDIYHDEYASRKSKGSQENED